MIKEIIMPKLGETMEEGVITKWMKNEGDKIQKGDPILEVSTDKASFEVESPAAGLLRSIVHPASETPVQVTKVIAFIADSMDEPIPEIKEEATPAASAPASSAPASTAAPSATAAAPGAVVKASPRAKKLAVEKGVDIKTVTGSGPGGRIIEKDILDAAAGTGGSPGEGIPLTGMRKTIAQRLSMSKREIPHYYLQVEIDMTNASSKKTEGISFNDIIIRAVAKTLEEFPNVNSLFENNLLKPQPNINVGVAVTIEGGLVVPVIKDTNKKSLKEISDATSVIKNKAKSGSFTPDDYAGGTITVSNLGMFKIDTFVAIINPPQVALIAVGTIKEVPAVVKGEIMARKMMNICASFDHRIVDGAEGAAFLGSLKKALEVDYEQL